MLSGCVPGAKTLRDHVATLHRHDCRRSPPEKDEAQKRKLQGEAGEAEVRVIRKQLRNWHGKAIGSAKRADCSGQEMANCSVHMTTATAITRMPCELEKNQKNKKKTHTNFPKVLGWSGTRKQKKKTSKKNIQFSRSLGIGVLPKESQNIAFLLLFFFSMCFWFFSKGPSPKSL